MAVVGRKLEGGRDPAGHLLTTQSPGWPPEGPALSERSSATAVWRTKPSSSTSCFHFLQIFHGLAWLAGRPYNFRTSHLYVICPGVASFYINMKLSVGVGAGLSSHESDLKMEIILEVAIPVEPRRNKILLLFWFSDYLNLAGFQKEFEVTIVKNTYAIKSFK